MLVIRLQRIGKKHQPSFRVVVAERRSKLGAPPVEDLGSFGSGKTANVNKERLEYWLKVGAKPTVTVHNFLVKNGALSSAKLPVKMKKAAKAAEQPQEQVPVKEAPKTENAEAAPAENVVAVSTDAPVENPAA